MWFVTSVAVGYAAALASFNLLHRRLPAPGLLAVAMVVGVGASYGLQALAR